MTTLQSSMDDLFGDEWTSSPAGSPARTSASPVKARGSKANGPVSGAKCFASSQNADPRLSSLKTYLLSEIEAQTRYSATWKQQATPGGRSWWVLTTSVRPTDENASGLWRSPNATMDRDDRWRDEGKVQAYLQKWHMVTIPLQVPLWPTMRASEGAVGKLRSPENIPNDRGRIEDAVSLWPTPRANKVEGYQSPQFRPNLNQRATLWPTATTREWKDGACQDANVPDNALLGRVCARWPAPDANCGERYGQNPERINSYRQFTINDSIRAFSRHPETTTYLGLLLQKWTRPSCPVLNEKFVSWLMGYPRDWFDGVELPFSKG